jgi:hypothetical protein
MNKLDIYCDCTGRPTKMLCVNDFIAQEFFRPADNYAIYQCTMCKKRKTAIWRNERRMLFWTELERLEIKDGEHPIIGFY